MYRETGEGTALGSLGTSLSGGRTVCVCWTTFLMLADLPVCVCVCVSFWASSG